MSQKTVLVCGEALFDFFQLEPAASAMGALQFEARAGGSPFNVARALARLGTHTAFLSAVSTDFLGDRLLAILDSDQVDTQYIPRTPAPTTISLVDETSARTPNYSFLGADTADRSLQPENLPRELDGFCGMHFGSFSLVMEPAADTYLQLAKRAAGRCLIALDPNIRRTVTPDLDVWRSRVAAFRQYADVVKASVEDLAVLAPESTAEQVAADWLRSGAQLVAITRGDEGATIWTTTACVSSTNPAVDVVDTVGAGDTFQAALLHRLVPHVGADSDRISALSTDTLADILCFANSAAALTCTARGANPPALAAVEAMRKELAK